MKHPEVHFPGQPGQLRLHLLDEPFPDGLIEPRHGIKIIFHQGQHLVVFLQRLLARGDQIAHVLRILFQEQTRLTGLPVMEVAFGHVLEVFQLRFGFGDIPRGKVSRPAFGLHSTHQELLAALPLLVGRDLFP